MSQEQHDTEITQVQYSGSVGMPARNYVWEPFKPGNAAALKHGGRSPRTFGPVADKLAEELLTVAPWCAGPAHRLTVAAWARNEAQAHLVAAWLDQVGILDDDGVPRPACALLSRLEHRAASLRTELGLSPLSLARLLGIVVTTAGSAGATDVLDALRKEGAAILAARSQ